MRTAGKRKGRGAQRVLSVWALLARGSIYKVAMTIIAMGMAETALFYGHLRSGSGYTLADTVDGSHISWGFLAGLGLVFFILARTEGSMEEKSRGTMLRLALSPGSIFLIKMIYNMLCLILLFTAQIWIAVWLVGLYGREIPEIYAPPQRLFLAFYRIEFLHCLLPMAETGKWVRNFLLLTTFSMEAAGGMGKKNYVPHILLYVLAVSWFVSPIGMRMEDVMCMGVCVIVAAADGWRMRKASVTAE